MALATESSASTIAPFPDIIKVGDIIRSDDATAASTPPEDEAEGGGGASQTDGFITGTNGVTGICTYTVANGDSRTHVQSTAYLYSMLQEGKRPEFMGVRSAKNPEAGFILHPIHQAMLMENYIMVEDDECEIESGDDVDFFSLDARACMADLEHTLGNLKRSLQHEKLLGALMFSCGGRGPEPRALPVAMADATNFRKAFLTYRYTVSTRVVKSGLRREQPTGRCS